MTNFIEEQNKINTTDSLDRVHRKLTKVAQTDLQQAFANAPGIPPVDVRIHRKQPNLFETLSGDRWLGSEIPYIRYKADWPSICAILPTYLLDGANGTVIYYIDGSYEVLHHRMLWVLDDLLEHLLTNKHITEQQSIRWMGGIPRRRVPLVVNNTFCLVPVTCRQAQRRNDGTTGYVVLNHIHRVLSVEEWQRHHRDNEDLLQDYDTILNRTQPSEDADDDATIILLRTETRYQCPKLMVRDNALTVQNNIYLAHQLLQQYTLIHTLGTGDPSPTKTENRRGWVSHPET